MVVFYLFVIFFLFLIIYAVVSGIKQGIENNKKAEAFRLKVEEYQIPNELLKAVSLPALKYQEWIVPLYSDREILKCLNDIDRAFAAAQQAKTLKTFKDKYELSAQKILSILYAAKKGRLTFAYEATFDECVRKITFFSSLRCGYLKDSYDKCAIDVSGMVTARGRVNKINKYISELTENEMFFFDVPEYTKTIDKAKNLLSFAAPPTISEKPSSARPKKPSNSIKKSASKDNNVTAVLLFNVQNNNGISRINESDLTSQELDFFKELQKQIIHSKLNPESIWLLSSDGGGWDIEAYSHKIGSFSIVANQDETSSYSLSYHSESSEKQICSKNFSDVIIAIPLWVRYIKKLHNSL